MCLWTDACSSTQWHIPTSLVYETPHLSPPSGPIQHGVQQAPRHTTKEDPLPVLSPFNDWISSRLPRSSVIAWWSVWCCAKARGVRLAVGLWLAWTRVSRNSFSRSILRCSSDSHSLGFSHCGGPEWKKGFVLGKKRDNRGIVSVNWTQKGLYYPKSIILHTHRLSFTLFSSSLLIAVIQLCFLLNHYYCSFQLPGFYLLLDLK